MPRRNAWWTRLILASGQSQIGRSDLLRRRYGNCAEQKHRRIDWIRKHHLPSVSFRQTKPTNSIT
jgi:hypothetical protein